MNHHRALRRLACPRARRVLSSTATPILLCAAACAPELPSQQRSYAEPEAEPRALIELEPAAPLDAAPPVLRLRARVSEARPDDVDLSRILLIQGRVGPAHLRQIERDEVSNALAKRVVPALAWLDDATPDDLAVVVAPLVPLDPGERYALASGNPPFAHSITVAVDGELPILPRVWPPPEQAATRNLGVWCGDAPLPEGATAAKLAPLGPEGELRRGAVGDVGARCVRFETADTATASPDEAAFVGAVAWGEPSAAFLDPRPFALEAEPAPPRPTPCDPGEIPFGPGCALVADDRIHVRSPDAPLLWAIGGEGLDDVVATRAIDPFVLAPLPPLRTIELAIATVDNAGQVTHASFSAETRAPMPHVIINEVMANPLGPEPAQEWVELYNDGTAAADLTGFVLADVGGETMLPEVSLSPGEHALIVSDAFVADDELDAPPPSETQLIRVAKLGSHGLSNAGEPLKLKDGGGVILSRSPAVSAPKAGMSIARARPLAPDGLPGSFVTGWPTPGRENIID